MNLAVGESRSFHPGACPIRAGSGEHRRKEMWSEYGGEQEGEISPADAKTGLLPGICPQKLGAKEGECLSESGNREEGGEPGK